MLVFQHEDMSSSPQDACKITPGTTVGICNPSTKETGIGRRLGLTNHLGHHVGEQHATKRRYSWRKGGRHLRNDGQGHCPEPHLHTHVPWSSHKHMHTCVQAYIIQAIKWLALILYNYTERENSWISGYSLWILWKFATWVKAATGFYFEL